LIDYKYKAKEKLIDEKVVFQNEVKCIIGKYVDQGNKCKQPVLKNIIR
jgi:hypothetical protein